MADNLPEDLILNILLRLPIKCLVRFRSVCKSWYTLLTNLEFVYKNLHYDHVNENPLLFVEAHDYTTDTLSLSLISTNKSINMSTTRKIKYVQGVLLETGTLGTRERTPDGLYCNGIICLYYGDFFVIWNPMTSETKFVPINDVLCFPDASPSCGEVAFGFDPKTNDYKIVLIVTLLYDYDEYASDFEDHVMIYSLLNESWRELDDCFPFQLDPSSRCNAYMNGTYYWNALCYQQEFILSLDLSSGVLNKTQLPDASIIGFNYQASNTIFALKESSIAMVLTYYHEKATEHSFDIWVLLEFGVRDSWIKFFTIQPLLDIEKLLGFWINGELVLKTCSGKMLTYDPIAQKSTQMQIEGVSDIYEVVYYKESRVLLNGS